MVGEIRRFLHDAKHATDPALSEVLHVVEDAHAAEIEITSVLIGCGDGNYEIHVEIFFHYKK